jgi:hypothetical protein
MSQLLARRLQRAGKLSLGLDEKNREDVKRRKLTLDLDEKPGDP